ncbi:hypothetical protein ACFL34_05560, partial [Candidatus Sumerlaeota bacterium]
MLDGLLCYNRWIRDFEDSEKVRAAGDSYCYGVYRDTHKAATGFLREIAPNFPDATDQLEAAATHFAAEAEALAGGEQVLWWNAPEDPDPQTNARVVEVLTKARDHYGRGIDAIEQALAQIPADPS